MEYSNTFGGFAVITGILSLILVITFFVMAYRLGKIKYFLEALYLFEERKPENRRLVKCDKCGKEHSLPANISGFIFCKECKHSFKVDER
jgi:hypothetical protein